MRIFKTEESMRGYYHYAKKLNFFYDEYFERLFSKKEYQRFLRLNMSLAGVRKERKKYNEYVNPLGIKSFQLFKDLTY